MSPATARPALARLAAALLCLLLAAGCVRTTDGRTDDGGPPTLTIATSFDIETLDPLDNGIWGVEFGYAELLMRPDRGGAPTPWVLTELASTSPLTWVLSLPPNASFVNGRPLDAAALAELLTFSLAENETFAAALPGATAVATGPLQVTMTTARPAPNVPTLLADEAIAPVFDVAAYRAHLASGRPATALLDAGLYTGPFVVEALDATSARLVPRRDHWAGAPALSAVTVRFVPEASARIQAVQAGEADIALYPPTASAPTLRGRADAHYVTGEATGPSFPLLLNHRIAPFDDARVRRAIYAAVDYDALANDVMNGLYEPATGLYVDSRPWFARTQTTDLAAAARLLDEAGWVRAGTGPRTRGAQELRVTLFSYPEQPDVDVLALALQDQLGRQGIAVDIRQVPDIDDFLEQRPTEWQAAVSARGFISFGGDYVQPLRTILRTDGTRNFAGVADPELDALIDRVGVELDPATRDELLRTIQRRVADGGHWAYVGLRRPAVVTGPAWNGYAIQGSNLWVGRDTAPVTAE